MPATACSWRKNRRRLRLHRSTTLSHLFHLSRGKCWFHGWNILSDIAENVAAGMIDCASWTRHLMITNAWVAMCVREIQIKQPLVVLLFYLSMLVGFIHPNYRYVQNHEWLLVYVGYVTVWILCLFSLWKQAMSDSLHTIRSVCFTSYSETHTSTLRAYVFISECLSMPYEREDTWLAWTPFFNK